MNSQRILGVVILLTAALGVILSVGGVVVGREVVDRVAMELDVGLTTAADTLENLDRTLQLTNDVIDQVVASLDTVEDALSNASKALQETRPMVKDVGGIVTGDVADALESVQNAIDPLVSLSATIDTVLRGLSDFAVEETILGIPVTIDLGIEYDPEVSLPDTVQAIGDSIEGLPESLRVLSEDVENADANLGIISQDLTAISSDLGEIHNSLGELPDLVDGFSGNVDSAQEQIQSVQSRLNDAIQLVKTATIVFFVWLGLTQIAPLSWGYELIAGRGASKDEIADQPED
jgi:ABC-type transporter Mla subunit MlaD